MTPFRLDVPNGPATFSTHSEGAGCFCREPIAQFCLLIDHQSPNTLGDLAVYGERRRIRSVFHRPPMAVYGGNFGGLWRIDRQCTCVIDRHWRPMVKGLVCLGVSHRPPTPHCVGDLWRPMAEDCLATNSTEHTTSRQRNALSASIWSPSGGGHVSHFATCAPTAVSSMREQRAAKREKKLDEAAQ